MRFGRNYRLTIETNDGNAIVIEPPLTIDFTLERSTLSSLNSAQIQVYNLSEKSRSRIFQDRFTQRPDGYKRVVLQAGYGKLNTIFRGNIFQATSTRQGADILTYIDARDGAFDAERGFTSRTETPKNTKELVQQLLGDFENVTEGTITDTGTEFNRPVTLNGNTFDLINKYTNGKAYIDLEQVNVLDDNEVIEGVLPLITSETGLLATPKRENAYLSIETMFRPEITIAQLLEVRSSVNSAYDGQYKVIGLQHRATISEAVGGEARSRFDLLVGSQLFGEFNKVS